MENKLKVKELLRFCVATHFDKLKIPMSETKLLKFLHETTNSLPETNTLKKSIPFYWYIHGPFSPPLLELSQELLNEKILKQNNQGFTATSHRLYHDEDLQKAKQILTSIIDKSASANSMTAIKEPNLQHPYRFYISFKREFSSKLYNYLYDENTIFKTKELKDILHGTIGDLANNSLFSRFKYAYLDYISIMIKLIKLELIEVSQKDTLQTTTDDLFETFAKGVRILHHDAYFDSEVPKWKKEFEESVNQMEQNIDRLYDLAVNLGANKTMLTFSTLVEQVLHLKSKDQLVMISFLPPRNIAQLNYGKIDAEFFEKLNDDEFQDLLNKFKNSHNAVVCHTIKKEIISTTYRMQAS